MNERIRIGREEERKGLKEGKIYWEGREEEDIWKRRRDDEGKEEEGEWERNIGEGRGRERKEGRMEEEGKEEQKKRRV